MPALRRQVLGTVHSGPFRNVTSPWCAPASLRRSSWTAIRSDPGITSLPWRVRKRRRAMATVIFAARVPLPNADATLRARNDGSGENFHRLSTRRLCCCAGPALWIWQTLWNWIGW